MDKYEKSWDKYWNNMPLFERMVNKFFCQKQSLKRLHIRLAKEVDALR